MNIPENKLVDVCLLLQRLGQRRLLRALVGQSLETRGGDRRLHAISGINELADGNADEGRRILASAIAQPGVEPSLDAAVASLIENQAEAVTIAEALQKATADVDPVETHRIVASILEDAGDAAGAIDILEQALSAHPGSFDAKLALAYMLVNHAGHQITILARAEVILRDLEALKPDHPEVCIGLATAVAQQAKSVEAEPYFRRYFEMRPDDVTATRRYFDCLIENDKHADVVDAAKIALGHWPDDLMIKSYLADCERYLGTASRPRMARWPQRLSQLEDLEAAIREHVCKVDVPSRFRFSRDQSVVTIGSCFAENIARALRASGIDAHNAMFGEPLNSTYAAKAYVSRVGGASLDTVGEQVIAIQGRDPVADRPWFEDAALAIVTLGVAPCLFSTETGDFMLFQEREFSFKQLDKQYVWRNTSVDENKDNLRSIIETLRAINPAVHIVLTVSPVPLKVTFDYDNAFVADSISKSTLRAAADEIIREFPGMIFYWPSFEVFRWLGAYAGPVYGGGDGDSSVHPSEAIVDLVFKVFFEMFCVDEAAGQ